MKGNRYLNLTKKFRKKRFFSIANQSQIVYNVLAKPMKVISGNTKYGGEQT